MLNGLLKATPVGVFAGLAFDGGTAAASGSIDDRVRTLPSFGDDTRETRVLETVPEAVLPDSTRFARVIR
jgi:hypothetical protein